MNKYLKYGQGEIKIITSGQKMYEITDDVNAWIKKEEISGGQLTIFIKHTSASLCIQENASREVLEDIDNFLKKLVPENSTLYTHNSEAVSYTHLTLPTKRIV